MSFRDRHSDSAAIKRPACLGRALAWLFASRAGLAVTRIAAACAARRRIKIAIDELSRWDEHWLRDIGLDRMDIERMVRMQPRPDRGEAGGAHDPRRPAGGQTGVLRDHRGTATAPGGPRLAPQEAAANDNRSAAPAAAAPGRAADRR